MKRIWAHVCGVGWTVLFHESFLHVVTWRGGNWQVGRLAVPPNCVWALLGVATFTAQFLAYGATALLLGSGPGRARPRPSLALTLFYLYLALGTLLVDTALLFRVPALQVTLSALHLDFVGRVMYELGVLLCFIPMAIMVFPIRPVGVPPSHPSLVSWDMIKGAAREAYTRTKTFSSVE